MLSRTRMSTNSVLLSLEREREREVAMGAQAA